MFEKIYWYHLIILTKTNKILSSAYWINCMHQKGVINIISKIFKWEVNSFTIKYDEVYVGILNSAMNVRYCFLFFLLMFRIQTRIK